MKHGVFFHFSSDDQVAFNILIGIGVGKL